MLQKLAPFQITSVFNFRKKTILKKEDILHDTKYSLK